MYKKKYGFGATLFLLVIFFLVTYAHGHKSGGFYLGNYVDESDFHADWMSSLPDGWLISELSIPGTHDTMTFKGVPSLDKFTMQTQTLSLITQLNAGIRALDIRLVLNDDGDGFNIHHGDIDLDSTFTDVLNVVVQFLEGNSDEIPDETFLMRLKRERPEGEDDDTTEFFSTLDSIILNYPDLFWLPSAEDGSSGVSKWDHTIEVPNLGDVRGKIVVFDDMPLKADREEDGELYGLPYEKDNSYFSIQDEYQLKCKQACTNNLYNKWGYIKEQFSSASGSDEYIY